MTVYLNENHPAAAWGMQINDILAGILGLPASSFLVEWGGANPNYCRVEVAGVTEGALVAAMGLFGSLAAVADVPVIAADGVAEAGVSCGLAAFDYRVYKDNAVILSGSVADGVLEFSTDDPGAYVIEVIGADGASGYVEIEAEEV